MEYSQYIPSIATIFVCTKDTRKTAFAKLHGMSRETVVPAMTL